MLDFADLLQRCSQDRKTGLVNATVLQSSRFPVRIYFLDGNIIRLSYGPLYNQECLDLLQYYDLGRAMYVDGVKAPVNMSNVPSTQNIISSIRDMNKTIRLDQWIEGRVLTR